MTIEEQNEIKKKFLGGYRRIISRIERIEEDIKTYREEIESAKAIEYSDMPKGHKRTDLSDYMVQLEGMENKLIEKVEQKKLEKLEIERCIATVEDDLENEILHKRYIQLKPWPDIADEIGYSERQVYRYHEKALCNLKYDCGGNVS